MKRLAQIFAVGFALLLFGAPIAAAQTCPEVQESITQMERAGFGGAYRDGWYFGYDRFRNGCQTEMADALADFRSRHNADLSGASLTRYRFGLLLLEGQLSAEVGQYERASALYRSAREESGRAYDPAFYDAYIAFFARDRSATEQARELLAQRLQIANRTGNALLSAQWQLAKLDGLLACFERPFLQADRECAAQFLR